MTKQKIIEEVNYCTGLVVVGVMIVVFEIYYHYHEFKRRKL